MQPSETAAPFVVSARKYRPTTWRSVVGQDHVTQTLRNAIGADKLAQAFLFCGPRGVGKTTCARILAKTINCTNRTTDGEACDQCDSCRAFRQQASFNVFELDAASNNTVDDIRTLVEQVRYPPQAGRYKVYIIDEVHMLSNAAFNAFLKTLEEPPAYAIFILATTERHKILPTILSRCQIFDFNRIRPDDIARHLAYIAGAEGIATEPEGLHLIAQKADGGLRDALSIFDQIVTFSSGNVTYRAVTDNLHVLDYDTYFRLTEALLADQHAAALLLFDDVLRQGFDPHLFLIGWAGHLRDLLVSQDAATVRLLEVADALKPRYARQAEAAPAAWLLSALALAGTADRDYKQARNARLHVELLLLRAAHLRGALRFADLASGAHLLAAAPVAPAHGVPLNGSGTNAEAEKKKPESESKSGPEPTLTAKGADPRAAELADVSLLADARPRYGSPPLASVAPPLAPAAAPASVAAPVSLNGGKTLGNRVPGLATAAAIRPAPAALVDAPSGAEVASSFGNEPVSAEAFAVAWRELVQQKQDAGRMLDFSVLNRVVAFDAATLEGQLTLDNAVQLGQFNELRPGLLTALRTRLRNGRVQLAAEFVQQQQGRRLYTDSEKLAYLTEKHPALSELRERLSLEPNF